MGEGGQIWLKCITGDLIMMIRDKNNIFERVENFHADLAWNYPNDKTIITICLGYQHILEVAIPSGIILLVGIIAVISCVVSKRPEKKQEEMNADENPVYGVYQLSDTYERQYSTNEAVDTNDYYE